MGSLLEYLQDTQADFRKARLASLYSDFGTQRQSNPDGYSANISAWEKGLEAAAKAGRLGPSILSICFDEALKQELDSHQYGRPQALQAVEEEGSKGGRLLGLTRFLDTDRPYSSSTSASTSASGNSPWTFATWLLRQTGISDAAQLDARHCYVLQENLEGVGRLLQAGLSSLQRRIDRIIPMDDFKLRLNRALDVQELSSTDLNVLLKHLERDKGLIVYDGGTVKVLNSSAAGKVLTEDDRHISSLKSSISQLQGQVDKVTKTIDDLTIKAKQALSEKKKDQALRFLRSRKVNEALLSKRNDVLFNLEDIYNKIEEAEDHLSVLEAMEGSRIVLKNLNAKTGGVDRVNDVLESLRDEMAQVDEVSSAISDHAEIGAIETEGEINDELAELEAESRQQQAQKEDADSLELSQRLENLHIPTSPEPTKSKDTAAPLPEG